MGGMVLPRDVEHKEVSAINIISLAVKAVPPYPRELASFGAF